ncbi:MAG TPA: UvrD-helicase domain-containing protein, partial [Abditibacterium sp.]
MSHQFSLFDAPSPSPSSQTEFNYGRDLSPQQAKVRDHGAGNQVVVAGAGTGKTEALTQRILKLLVEGDGNGPIELEAILALTFTDKGAAEMRGRVYARLVEILRDLPRGEHRARLERIRANFAENHRILTFDAFSFRLLGQFPDFSPLMGETQVLDGGVRRQMRREVTRQFWNRVETTFSDAQKRELWQLLEVFPSRRAALEAIYRLAEAETEEQLRIWADLPPADEWREEFATLVSRDGER